MKKLVSMILAVVMLVGLVPTFAFAANEPLLPEQKEANMDFKDGFTYFVITPDQITDMGGWIYQFGTAFKSYREKTMLDLDGEKVMADATFDITLPKDGEYVFFAHSRDFETNGPGTRNFMVNVDEKAIGIAGKHNLEGWAWENIGSKTLTAGEHKLSFVDAEKCARFDLILVTDDKDFFPGNKLDELKKLETEYLFDASKVVVEKADPTEGRPDYEIAVKLDGKWLEFDVPPVLLNDRTMVPMRAIFEALGAEVSWDDTTQTATGVREGVTVSVTIDSTVAKVDSAEKTLDQPPVLKDSRTLVPLRFISEAFGAEVAWDDANQIVTIKSPVKEQPKQDTLPKGEFATEVGQVSSELPDFGTIKIKYVGSGSDKGKIRFIVPRNLFPFEITENILAGVKADIVFTDIATNKSIDVETFVAGSEMRMIDGVEDKYNFTISIEPTEEMPAGAYMNNEKNERNKFEITLSYPTK